MTLEFAAATRLTRQLSELGELLAYAHLALLPGAGRRGARVTGATRTAPLPCSVDVLSLLGPATTPRGAVADPHRDQTGPTPILGTLASWVRLHEEEGPFVDCATYDIGGMLDYLRARNVLAWAVVQPWADEYAAEINDAHRALQPYALLRARRRALALPCPRCGLLALTIEDGQDVECGNPSCGVILRQHEYDDRVEQHLVELNAA